MPAHFTLLYVEDTAVSAAFYSALLGRAPVESSPTFAMFPLGPGLMLGLWSRRMVQSAAGEADGELAFAVDGPEMVDQTFDDWCGNGLVVLQPPCAMDFGRTFVALDPDGHRLRVFAPETSPPS